MIARSDINMTIVFDNYYFADAIWNDLKTLWGFSCYIETPHKTILFDTGSNGRVLLANMEKQNTSINKIDTIFLTHHHWDHIGGLDSVIELNPDIEIIAPSSLSKLMIKDLKTMVSQVTTIEENVTQLFDDVYTTGLMGDDVKEQSIIIDTDEGLILITGCAHNGVVDIVKKSQQLLNKKISLLLGGFHLMGEDETAINTVIKELKKMNIDYLCPTHCTGDTAKVLFKNSFNQAYIEGGLGKVF